MSIFNNIKPFTAEELEELAREEEQLAERLAEADRIAAPAIEEALQIIYGEDKPNGNS